MSQYVPLGLHLHILLLFLVLLVIFLISMVLCDEARRQSERDLTGPSTHRDK